MPSSLFHISSLSPLYEDVQQSGIFSDSKYFVDALPKEHPDSILEKYHSEKEKTSFNLLAFIHQYFELPATNEDSYLSAQKPILTHLAALWKVLERKPDETGGTLITLPYPYIVPGGRFREIYYWDSYFTMLGLAVNRQYDLIENMIRNFAYLINKIGHIPNGNRTYYISRSQPPFFGMMVGLLASIKGNTTIVEYLPALEKEYQFWMDGAHTLTDHTRCHRRVVRMPDGTVLNRYWDDDASPRPEAYIEDLHVAAASNRPKEDVYRHIRAAAESGWDFSSRWFAEEQHMHTIQTTDIVPVDLNCLLFHLEEVLLTCYQLKKEEEAIRLFTEKKNNRKKAIQKYCWNEAIGFYYDYHFVKQASTERITMAGCFPLFTGIAESYQANSVAGAIERKLLSEGGVLTTTATTGQQWDAPNGWAPLQWVAYKGLSNYGIQSLAEKIRQRWMQLNEKIYAETGKMMEKYNVADTNIKAGGGEYPNQDGFGWTNGVYLAMREEQKNREIRNKE
jgi:alpha,alpha-trehalase